jgi:phosphoglycerate-specific signal transduction histidine kinase
MQNKNNAKQHLNVIKNISKKLDFNENGQEFISKFKEVKDLLDTYSAKIRQKYATIIRMLLDYLNLKNDVHTEFVQKYNSISARAQTPNPRSRPPKGPDTTVYKKEKEERVERKIIEEPEKVERLSRNSKQTFIKFTNI